MKKTIEEGSSFPYLKVNVFDMVSSSLVKQCDAFEFDVIDTLSRRDTTRLIDLYTAADDSIDDIIAAAGMHLWMKTNHASSVILHDGEPELIFSVLDSCMPSLIRYKQLYDIVEKYIMHESSILMLVEHKDPNILHLLDAMIYGDDFTYDELIKLTGKSRLTIVNCMKFMRNLSTPLISEFKTHSDNKIHFKLSTYGKLMYAYYSRSDRAVASYQKALKRAEYISMVYEEKQKEIRW